MTPYRTTASIARHARAALELLLGILAINGYIYTTEDPTIVADTAINTAFLIVAMVVVWRLLNYAATRSISSMADIPVVIILGYLAPGLFFLTGTAATVAVVAVFATVATHLLAAGAELVADKREEPNPHVVYVSWNDSATAKAVLKLKEDRER